MNDLFPIHVRTVTGLEQLLAAELLALGAQDVQTKVRLVTCTGDRTLMYKANLWCRSAIRVLLPITSFPAKNEKAFYEGVGKIDWTPWLRSTGTLAIETNVRSSFTTHSLFLSQLAKDAIVDQFRERSGQRPSVDLERPDVRVAVSLFEDVATLYLDSSGESLHKRGYRRKAGEAPVSETLAAGILKLANWDGTKPLFDPMCGAGTFLIEAGLMLRNMAPGLFRHEFGFQRWTDFDRPLWENLKTEAQVAARPSATMLLRGADNDASVVEIARENVQRAGLSDLIEIENADFFTSENIPTSPGVMVMNPPYDERLPIDNIAETYQRIGDRLKHAYAGWTAYVLAGNLDAVKYVGLRSSRRIPLFNGPIECRLLEYELRAATGEAEAPKWRKAIAEENPQWKARAEIFANRLKKNWKRESQWAKREKITCWRLYDWDIPELPFLVDIYGDRLHIAEVQRNHDHSPLEHGRWQQMMVRTAADALKIPVEKAYFKVRKPQTSGGFQYAPHAETETYHQVTEGGHKFLVNLADHLDVGLFLDHRKTRGMVQREVKGKDFLNLFAYTGSFTVYAAAGEANSTTTVDTSTTYLSWAEENLRINGLMGPQHQFVRSDTFEFLERTRATFDVCVVDPPTRSVNRSADRVFDVLTDHVPLLRLVLDRMKPGGRVFFSTNCRNFTFDEAGLREGRDVKIEEITANTVPQDFARRPSHRCWLLQR